jgi:hypothetical protein
MIARQIREQEKTKLTEEDKVEEEWYHGEKTGQIEIIDNGMVPGNSLKKELERKSVLNQNLLLLIKKK